MAEHNLAPPPAGIMAGCALFLDFDGTLVEIAERPDAIVPSREFYDVIACLGDGTAGSVTLLTGRSVDQVRRFLPDGSIGIAGSHGLELWMNGGAVTRPEAPAGMAEATAAIEAFAALHKDLVVERKPLGTALHYRLAPHLGPASHALVERLGAAHGLAVQPGKMVVELKPPAADKGIAVRALSGGRVPIMIGDDLTDESAFAAAAELGGHGILVGDMRDTAAHYRLASVAATLAWLGAECRIAA